MRAPQHETGKIGLRRQREGETHIRVLAAPASAKQLCVLWHEGGAGAVGRGRGVEQRAGGCADGAGELGDGGRYAGHGCLRRDVWRGEKSGWMGARMGGERK